MFQLTQSSNTGAAGVIGSIRQGLFSLPFLFASIPPALAQSGTPSRPSESLAQPQCRSIPINITSKGTTAESTTDLARVLEDFESSFQFANGDLFATVVSPALLKKKEDALKIFEGTLLEYDLRRAKLQRNWIWELNVGNSPEPGRIVQCGELGIQPVYGPLIQYAVQYSTFIGNNQTRLLVLFARSSVGMESGTRTETKGPGLVHLQVQRWTYDGRTPERLMTEAKRSASRGEKLIGALLAEASARVMEINPYLIPPLLKDSRDLANQLRKEFESDKKELFTFTAGVTDWKPENLVPIFRDGTLALGLKIRMQREYTLNEQTQKCQETARKYFASQSAWKAHFSGVECLAYSAGEELNKPPRGGSQFFPWAKLELQNH